MSVVFMDQSMVVAVTCNHVVSGEHNDVYIAANPSGADQPFGQVCKRYEVCDFALIQVHPKQHHTVNSVYSNNTSYDLHFEDFDFPVVVLRNYLMGRMVYKIGVITGLTEGKVVHLDEDKIMVQGVNGEVFAEPGDSGSLVFINGAHHNIVVGMVSKANDSGCVCWVVGVWKFYKFLHADT